MLPKTLFANIARAAAVRAAWFALAVVAFPMAAGARELGVKVEPGVAFPLSQPQSQRFDLGGGAAAKLLYGLAPYLDATAGVSFIGLPRSASSLSPGTATAWGYGGGLRLKRPHDAQSLYGMSPWVDADALYIRTGPLNRFGFAAATGLALPLGKARNFWLGPYVRYQQILGRGDSAVDGRDAKVLLAGLSFEFGSSPMASREVAHEAAAAASPAVAPVAAEAPGPDRDNDGTLDKDDLCPDVAGPISNHGCPDYEKVVVKPDKLELKEKIQFARNSPRIEQASHPPGRGREGSAGQPGFPRPARGARLVGRCGGAQPDARRAACAGGSRLPRQPWRGQGAARLQGLQLVRADRHEHHGRRP